MYRLLFFALFLLFSPLSAQSEEIRIDKTGAYLSGYDTASLKKMFSDLAYEKYIDLPDGEYPRIFVQNLPSDFGEFEDTTERNRVFMQILVPLILKVNDEILEEREIVEALSYDFEQNKDFDEADMYYIEELAKKYDISTPFKDTRRYIKLLAELKKKVDIVPPSILVASAAVRTNWGTSRVALLANNLFKQRVWFEEDGLTPVGDEDEGYKYKIYDSLEASIKDYVFKYNIIVIFKIFFYIFYIIIILCNKQSIIDYFMFNNIKVRIF